MHYSSDTSVSAIVVSSLGKHCVVLLSFTLYSVFILQISWTVLELCSDLLGSAIWKLYGLCYRLPWRCFSIPDI